jgi:hypothetical protein
MEPALQDALWQVWIQHYCAEAILSLEYFNLLELILRNELLHGVDLFYDDIQIYN